MSTPPDEVLAELRAAVGEFWAAAEFASDRVSKATFDRIERTRKGISTWRFTRENRWFVITMGEASHAAQVALARRTLEAAGGTLLDALPEPDMIDALRERRWQTALSAARAAIHEGEPVDGPSPRYRAHYPMGMRLGRDGSFTPNRKGQG